MNPKFSQFSGAFDINKMAYDLALSYTQAKISNIFQSGYEFKDWPAYREVNEMEYFWKMFLYAFDYFSNVEPGEVEHRIQQYHTSGTGPPRIRLDSQEEE